MLASVHVENIALIKNIDISFDDGFTVLTGETGAGKSIIVDSLCLLCGARSDREIIRTGESFALVEGIFSDLPEKTVAKLDELGYQPDEDGLLLLSRRITADGRGSAKVGSRSVTAARLREVASLLMGIHGQQETQTLSDTSKQLETLDCRAHDADIFAAYKVEYDKTQAIEAEVASLKSSEDEKAARIDFLRYRVEELKAFALQEGEEERLIAEKARLAAGERILRDSHEAYDWLYGRSGISARAQGAINALERLKDVVPEVSGLIERLYNIKYEAEDISESVFPLTETDGGEGTTRIDAVEERILNINTLKRKYRVNESDALIGKLAAMEDELLSLETAGETLAALEKQLKGQKKVLSEAAKQLSAARNEAAKLLVEETKKTLCFLDMPSVEFIIDIKPKEPAADGADDVCFLISANRGEEPRPMGKIASGGELSRIMLAIKRSLAQWEGVGTMIFDEIDTGISGATSDKIGMLLRGTASEGRCQVVCVTHSALLAAHADSHLLISKRVVGDRTRTEVLCLDREGRENELARIIGGVNVTEASRSAARELLERSEK